MRQSLGERAKELGLKIVSPTCSPTSDRSTRKRVASSSPDSLPFSLPLNTPVLKRLVEHLRTMEVDQIVLVEIVAIAIAKGQL